MFRRHLYHLQGALRRNLKLSKIQHVTEGIRIPLYFSRLFMRITPWRRRKQRRNI